MKKKICFIVSSPLTVKAFLLEHIKTLSEEFEVYLIANFEKKDSKNISPYIADEFNVKIIRKINIFQDLYALFELIKLIKTHNFDAIHTITPKAGLLGVLAGRLVNTKTRIHIFTGQVWYTKKGLMKFLLISIDRLIVALATNILVDGQSQRRFLINKNVIKENNSRVLGKGSISGVDIKKFSPKIEIKQRYRNQLNLNNKEIVFLFLGRLNIDKGVLDLAFAFAKLQKEFQNVKLLYIGDDEEKLSPKLYEIVGKENFQFYGPTKEPELLLQAGDVLCLPSYREGFGTSVIEGSLLELPIICSDTYGLQETIIENKTGLRHEVKNIEDIYNQMKKLAKNEDLRLNMGKEGRKYVLENFKATEISKKWLEYYKEILK